MPSWPRRWPRDIPTRNVQIYLPTPDAPDVDVHKIRSLVVADTAPMKRQGNIPQLCGRDPGHPNVNGHRLHVQTVACDAVSMSTQEFVAPRCSETTNDIDLKIGIPEGSSQVVEEIKHPGIVFMNFTGAVVAQKTVQASQGFQVVSFATAVNNVQSLSSVCVNKMQRI